MEVAWALDQVEHQEYTEHLRGQVERGIQATSSADYLQKLLDDSEEETLNYLLQAPQDRILLTVGAFRAIRLLRRRHEEYIQDGQEATEELIALEDEG